MATATTTEGYDAMTEEELRQRPADDAAMLELSYRFAKKGHDAGGCPIGSVVTGPAHPARADDGTPSFPTEASGSADPVVLGAGHNGLVQEGNPILHGEMAALRAVGRRSTRSDCVLYTSLSPCAMCTGAILMFRIPRVVVGDVTNADGADGENIRLLRRRGVQVDVREHAASVGLCNRFRHEKPQLWREDWGGPPPAWVRPDPTE